VESENPYRNKAVPIANTTQGTSNVDFCIVHADKSTAMDKELQEIIEKGGVVADEEGKSDVCYVTKMTILIQYQFQCMILQSGMAVKALEESITVLSSL
jgi:hypothetical protein